MNGKNWLYGLRDGCSFLNSWSKFILNALIITFTFIRIHFNHSQKEFSYLVFFPICPCRGSENFVFKKNHQVQEGYHESFQPVYLPWLGIDPLHISRPWKINKKWNLTIYHPSLPPPLCLLLRSIKIV